jgi:hypothetical protein
MSGNRSMNATALWKMHIGGISAETAKKGAS